MYPRPQQVEWRLFVQPPGKVGINTPINAETLRMGWSVISTAPDRLACSAFSASSKALLNLASYLAALASSKA